MISKQKIKAVVFDLDGTLLDTLPDLAAGSNAALRHAGLPERTIDDFRRMIGNGIRVLFRRACPEDVSEAAYEDALAFYLSYYPEHCTVYTKFYDGMEQTIKTLAEDGYALGVLSNKTEKTAIKIMNHFFSPNPFKIVWGNNNSRPLKPDATAGKLLCEELGISPDELMYVGDGDTDMEFGAKNGFYTVGVTWGYRDADVLKACGADVLINKPEELLTLL